MVYSSDIDIRDVYPRRYIQYIPQAWKALGKTYNRLFLFNKALIACNKAIDLDQDSMNTWDQIAIAYDGIRDFKLAKKAKKMYKKKEKKIIKIEKERVQR